MVLTCSGAYVIVRGEEVEAIRFSPCALLLLPGFAKTGG